MNGLKNAESYFLNAVEQYANGNQSMLDRSGSCAICSLFIDDVCYIINVGDSRSFMSAEGGKYTVALSRDHKPNDELEQARIEKAGGKIY